MKHSLAGKTLVFALLLAAIGATQRLGAQTISTNKTGTHNGYWYQFWKASGGTASMTLGSGGSYSVSYSNISDVVCGKGWNPGSSSRVIRFSNCSINGGDCRQSLYGWTTSPLIEYYVFENWGTATPGAGTNMGTVTSDGATYTIYKQQRVNAPSIQGTQTFWQYKNRRSGKRTSGSITFSNHANAWKSKSMNLGTHNLQIFATEAMNGATGSARATVQ